MKISMSGKGDMYLFIRSMGTYISRVKAGAWILTAHQTPTPTSTSTLINTKLEKLYSVGEIRLSLSAFNEYFHDTMKSLVKFISPEAAPYACFIWFIVTNVSQHARWRIEIGLSYTTSHAKAKPYHFTVDQSPNSVIGQHQSWKIP